LGRALGSPSGIAEGDRPSPEDKDVIFASGRRVSSADRHSGLGPRGQKKRADQKKVVPQEKRTSTHRGGSMTANMQEREVGYKEEEAVSTKLSPGATQEDPPTRRKGGAQKYP